VSLSSLGSEATGAQPSKGCVHPIRTPSTTTDASPIPFPKTEVTHQAPHHNPRGAHTRRHRTRRQLPEPCPERLDSTRMVAAASRLHPQPRRLVDSKHRQRIFRRVAERQAQHVRRRVLRVMSACGIIEI